MRYFFDTEFIDDGKTIDLISIGIVSQDGREYYAESTECDHSRAVPWVKQHVISKLEGGRYLKSRAVIARDIVEYIGFKTPEFWAYFGAYDWIALSQLYGTMLSVPKNWPNRCNDLAQLKQMTSHALIDHKGRQHHALDDAIWTKKAFENLLEQRYQLILR